MTEAGGTADPVNESPTASSDVCYINHQPLEILSSILSAFDVKRRLLVFRLVCRHWNDCIENDLKSLSAVDLGGGTWQDRETFSLTKYTAFLPEIATCDHVLDDKVFENRSYVVPLEQIVTFIRKRCPNLRVIKIGSKWVPHVEDLMSLLGPRIECLHASFMDLKDEDVGSMKPCSDSCLNLRHLAVKSVQMSHFFRFFPNVVRITCCLIRDDILTTLPIGFERLCVSSGPPLDYLNILHESPARDTIKELLLSNIVINGRLNDVSFKCLETLVITDYPSQDTGILLQMVARCRALKRLELLHLNGQEEEKKEEGKEENRNWIQLFRNTRRMETLHVYIHEVSDEVFQVLASCLTHVKNIKMTLTGDRVAATDSVFRSLTQISALETIDLFFEQETENVSQEVMLQFITGPSQSSLNVVRIEMDGEPEDYEKFDECVGEMMEMVSEHKLGIGEIFGAAID